MESRSSQGADDEPGFSPATRLDAPLQADLASRSNDRLGKRLITPYFRINTVKLMNFQPLAVKHTVFLLTAGGKIEKKKTLEVPGVNLFCLGRMKRGLLTKPTSRKITYDPTAHR